MEGVGSGRGGGTGGPAVDYIHLKVIGSGQGEGVSRRVRTRGWNVLGRGKGVVARRGKKGGGVLCRGKGEGL